MPASEAALVRGQWFDGRRSAAQPVILSLHREGRRARLELAPLAGGAARLAFDEKQVGWPERWSASRMPRSVTVDLREQGSVEIQDVAAWQAACEAAGVRVTLAERMQTRWRVFAGVLLLAVFGLFAFYRWGTPWAATQVTRHVPLQWELALADQALRELDGQLLKPSKLPPERQAQLRAQFERIARELTPALRRYESYAPKLALSLRSGLGANAFALPGGTIVVTDGMVEEAAKRQLGDEALAGVLAHEIGHVVHRHTTRMVVEQAVLNIGLGLALGDMSMLVSMGGSAITGLAYRRGHETEADCFAVRLMAQAKLPTAPMADLLLGLSGDEPAKREGAEGKDAKGDGAKSDGVKAPDAPARAPSWATLLSTHPDTAERAHRLKREGPRGC